MSKLAHSSDEHMAQIERDIARENGDLRRCRSCYAENIIDDPECPRGGVCCDIYTVPPTTGPAP
jgi:hypothetical protein